MAGESVLSHKRSFGVSARPSSSAPRAILELATIRLLVDAGMLVVCAGVGGAGYSSLERTTVIFSTCMSRMV